MRSDKQPGSEAQPSSWYGRLLCGVRLGRKAQIGALLLSVPTALLLYIFTATVNRSIGFSEKELCGVAYHQQLTSLLVQAADPASGQALPAQFETIERLQGCGLASDDFKALRQAWVEHRRESAEVRRQALQSRLLGLQATVGDQTNLILDPELDTYYVADFMVARFPEMWRALQGTGHEGVPDTAVLAGQVPGLRRNLATAAAYSAAHRSSSDSLQDTIGADVANLATAIHDLPSGPGAAPDDARHRALQVLLALYGEASAWESRALAARLAELRRSRAWTYAIVLTAMLLTLSFAWLVVRDSGRRLARLGAWSKRIAHDEPLIDVQIHGSDEVAELSRSFAAMARDLHQVHASLEQRIRERTAAAEAAEERLRLVVESAPAAFMMVDDAGRIVLVNAELERMLGYSRAELNDSKLEVLIPERFRTRHAEDCAAFLRDARARVMGYGNDLYARRKNGEEVPVEIGLNPLQIGERRYVLASIMDITRRKESERLTRAAEADTLRESILRSMPASVVAIDTAGSIVAINPAAEHLLGYTREELIGRSVEMIHDPQELQRRATDLSRKLGTTIPANVQVLVAAGSGDVPDEREWTYRRKDGSVIPVQIAITTLRDADGKVTGFLKVANDISARKRAEASIRHMAEHDALTGLPNRSLLADRLRMATLQARRNDSQVAVLLLDLDQFKHINDTLGHHVGDELLRAIARRIEGCVREVDTVGRLGGDEFVVLVTEVRDRRDLEPLIGQIAKAVAQPLRIEEHELRVTPSIGGCLYPKDGADAVTLLKKADAAMYQAKAAGRGTFKWFVEAMLQESKEKLALGTALRRAQDLHEFSLTFQPKVALASGSIPGVEALLRWQHGREGVVSPMKFIPIAEDSGVIVPVGEWVLRNACRQCVEMQQEMGRPLSVAVNVSARQFDQKQWLQVVKSALAESGLDPTWLELEITESILMQHPDRVADLLSAIRNLGVRIVVDDFGTGYSSLSYLTRFPIDSIKIDRSFVRDLTTDAKDAAIVNAIIAMAKRLNIKVIAEGVETLEQHLHLAEEGCDEAQGYLYAKALSAAELVRSLPDIEIRAAQCGSGAARRFELTKWISGERSAA